MRNVKNVTVTGWFFFPKWDLNIPMRCFGISSTFTSPFNVILLNVGTEITDWFLWGGKTWNNGIPPSRRIFQYIIICVIILMCSSLCVSKKNELVFFSCQNIYNSLDIDLVIDVYSGDTKFQTKQNNKKHKNRWPRYFSKDAVTKRMTWLRPKPGDFFSNSGAPECGDAGNLYDRWFFVRETISGKPTRFFKSWPRERTHSRDLFRGKTCPPFGGSKWSLWRSW